MPAASLADVTRTSGRLSRSHIHRKNTLMAWIDIIEPEVADERLTNLFEKVRSPDGRIDNIMKIHSLRPRTMQAHLELYKATLHSSPNGLTLRERELVGVCVSAWNECHY